MKIKEISASFSMKKNLGNYQTADMWFSANAEVMEGDKEDEVAQSIYDFCKTMAVKQYNEFSLEVPKPKTAEEEYFDTKKEWECVLGHKVVGERCLHRDHYKSEAEQQEQISYYADKDGNKHKIIKQDLKPY